jgi:hypothetical protein
MTLGTALLTVAIGLAAIVAGDVWSRRYLLDHLPEIAREPEGSRIQEVANKALLGSSGLNFLHELSVVGFLGGLCWLADRYRLPLWMMLTVFILATPVLVVSRYWAFKSRVQRSVRTWLVMRGIPICLRCGYDLRGQADPRCPECGNPFDSSLLRSQAGPGEHDRQIGGASADGREP